MLKTGFEYKFQFFSYLFVGFKLIYCLVMFIKILSVDLMSLKLSILNKNKKN